MEYSNVNHFDAIARESNENHDKQYAYNNISLSLIQYTNEMSNVLLLISFDKYFNNDPSSYI